MKKIYIVRHCEANGQPSESSLTQKGFEQSIELNQFFSTKQIDRIISSPFLRAIQSIEPTVKSKQLKLETDNRLAERILSTKEYPDWLKKLEETYNNVELKFDGGESSKEATMRVLSLIEEVINNKFEHTIIVTHGNLMSLLLRHYDQEFGFEQWKMLSNPDVFELNVETHQTKHKRIWNEMKVNN